MGKNTKLLNPNALCPTMTGYISNLTVKSKEPLQFKVAVGLREEPNHSVIPLKSGPTLKSNDSDSNHSFLLHFDIASLLYIREQWTLAIRIMNKGCTKTLAYFYHALWPYANNRRGFFEKFKCDCFSSKSGSSKDEKKLEVSFDLQLFDGSFYVVNCYGRRVVPGLNFCISKTIRLTIRNDVVKYIDLITGGISTKPPPSEFSSENLMLSRKNQWTNIDSLKSKPKQCDYLKMPCNQDFLKLVKENNLENIPNHIKPVIMNNDLVWEDIESGTRTNFYFDFSNSNKHRPNIGEAGQWIVRKLNPQLVNRERQISAQNKKESIEENSYHTVLDYEESIPLGWKVLEDKKRSIVLYLHKKSNIKLMSPPKVSSDWEVNYNKQNFQELVNVFTGKVVQTSVDDDGDFVDIVDGLTMKEGHQIDRSDNRPSESYKVSLANIKAMIELNHTNIRFKFMTKKDDLFSSKCDALNELSYSAFHQQFMINFREAAGIDYGALSNQYVLEFSEDFFKPENGVFCKISEKSDYLMLNPLNFKPNYLKAFGRLMALCLFQQKNISHGPSLIFFKNLARRDIVLSDTKDIDEEFYQNNIYLLENDIDEMDLGLNFTAEMPLPNGDSKTIELVPDGENITVTDENKSKYVRLLVSWNYKGIYQKHFDVILNEFTSIIPIEILTSLKSIEIQFVICGLSIIDIDDWEKNTEYQDYTAKSVTIQHFWQFLRSLSAGDVAKIKHFATGTTSVPPGGFADLKSMNKSMKFNIKRIPIITNLQQAPLPLSHACFNKLELPDYKNYDVLVEKLMFAAKETNSFELK